MLICKAAPAVGNAGCRASGCMELCAQTPSLKLGHTGRRLARGTLGLGGSGRRRGLEVLTVGPSEKRTRPAWRHWPPCPTPKSSQSIAWKPGLSMIWKRRRLRSSFQPWVGRAQQKCVFRTECRVVVGVCLYKLNFSFENAFSLHYWCAGVFFHRNDTFVLTVFIIF